MWLHSELVCHNFPVCRWFPETRNNSDSNIVGWYLHIQTFPLTQFLKKFSPVAVFKPNGAMRNFPTTTIIISLSSSMFKCSIREEIILKLILTAIQKETRFELKIIKQGWWKTIVFESFRVKIFVWKDFCGCWLSAMYYLWI